LQRGRPFYRLFRKKPAKTQKKPTKTQEKPTKTQEKPLAIDIALV
jgi:hypothetical protein